MTIQNFEVICTCKLSYTADISDKNRLKVNFLRNYPVGTCNSCLDVSMQISHENYTISERGYRDVAYMCIYYRYDILKYKQADIIGPIFMSVEAILFDSQE
jgi:hypothetical protein